MTARGLTEAHQRALTALGTPLEVDGDPVFLNFRGIARLGEMEPRTVRRAVRHLARKGLAQYGKGLWSDDGPAGSGYAITDLGRAALAEREGTDRG